MKLKKSELFDDNVVAECANEPVHVFDTILFLSAFLLITVYMAILIYL